MHNSTLVLGASLNPSRYAHLAILRLRGAGLPVLAVGARTGFIQDVAVRTELPLERTIDTVTLYLNPVVQEQWHERILALRPRRIIFNPGTEHPAFAQRASEQGIEVVEACTLVMLATGQY
jgi:predicted CoA-binding protein